MTEEKSLSRKIQESVLAEQEAKEQEIRAAYQRSRALALVDTPSSGQSRMAAHRGQLEARHVRTRRKNRAASRSRARNRR